jgi:hypothetical protein
MPGTGAASFFSRSTISDATALRSSRGRSVIVS